MPEAGTRRAPTRRHPGWVAAVGLALVAVGATLWWAQSTRTQALTADPGGRAAGAPSAGSPAEPVLARREPGAPQRVRIPALRVDAPVLPVRAPGRTLVPPSDPQRLGWWADGAKPGATTGSALVAGHTVHDGGGALDHLEDLERGDRVVVRTDKSTIRYDVRRVHVYSKGSLAEHATTLFSQRVPGRLVLITCEDWDGERYLSNVVVTATPVA
ncbi:class F sortase [Nocardioides sp.]|uniref:class F sortase n=1 Tax=Nocardioides sp. TaxID=35761 RepID=UPI00260B7B8D|nr:class F sortase [Nocardioides sp.]MDI6908301.1 class F sortase [Nocardioides sp.]